MFYEDELIRMEVLDTGIIWAYYKPHIFIELAEAKQIVAARKKLANNQPHAVIVDGGPIEIAPEARKYAQTKESSDLISAWAIIDKKSLFKSVFLKLLFFTQGRWSTVRFFDTKDEGMEWLVNNRRIWTRERHLKF